MFVRVKKIGGNRYVYLSEGVSKGGRVRQKTLCYLGPIAKVVSGIPDETREKVERLVGTVDWNRINTAIRAIPVTFEELQEMKRSRLPIAIGIRQNGSRNVSRGNVPRAEGELAALEMMARRSFNEIFETVGEKVSYAMRTRKSPSTKYRRPVRAKALIPQLKREPNPQKMKMLLLGYITDRLEKVSQSVFLVGGQAVETYTGGQFLTGDIDITTTDSKATEKILASLGFKQIGMIWLNKQLGVAVQIVGLFPNANLDKALTIEVGPYKVSVIGVEDLMVDRLAHVKFFKVAGDMEKAKVLYAIFKKQIDEKYLRETAKKRGVEDMLHQATVPESPSQARGDRRRISRITQCHEVSREKIEYSLFAFSGLSEAWITFEVIETDKSPRIVPGSAVRGFVAPITLRSVSTAFGAWRTIRTTGPEVTWSTSSWKNGFPLCTL